ncbi:MAG: acetolactate synthase small subunit [Verrucomicrobia subdivision 3 bacterium]|nr:acetolactate synthase small subunit [Limisphaerales bacterium]
MLVRTVVLVLFRVFAILLHNTPIGFEVCSLIGLHCGPLDRLTEFLIFPLPKTVDPEKPLRLVCGAMRRCEPLRQTEQFLWPVAARRSVPRERGFFDLADMRHTISVLVENKFGVLTRVAGLFSGRGYNIDTLNVGPTQDPNTSRMTIVTRGDDATLEQIVRQLNKLVDVIAVQDFRDGEYVDRELVLVKVNVDSKSRAEVMQITDIFRAKIVDVQPRTLTIEITGNESKVQKFLDLMSTFGIAELSRTGKVALPRK